MEQSVNTYKEGFDFFDPGMDMDESNKCPYEIGSDALRKEWLDGYFDAYFQHLFTKHNLGDRS